MTILMIFFGCTKTLPSSISNGLSIQSANSSFVIPYSDIEKTEEKEGDFGCTWNITLSPSAKERFAQYTTQNIKKKLNLMLHDKMLSSPTIMEPILDGVIAVSHGDSCSNVHKNLLNSK